MLESNRVFRVGSAAALVLALLAGCASKTMLVDVPPQVDMSVYPTTGIIDFTSNIDPASAQQATRRFQESVQEAQPGTRFVELGSRDRVLASVGARELDADAVRRIGQKYGVAAFFVGDIVYSEPKVDITVFDPVNLKAAAKAEVKGDMSSRLLETNSGASVWSRSSWAKRQLGSVRVAGDVGVSGRMSQANPHDEMVPDMVYHLTHAFRGTTVRRRIE